MEKDRMPLQLLPHYEALQSMYLSRSLSEQLAELSFNTVATATTEKILCSLWLLLQYEAPQSLITQQPRCVASLSCNLGHHNIIY